MRFWPFGNRGATPPAAAPARPQQAARASHATLAGMRRAPGSGFARLYLAAAQDRLMADMPMSLRSANAEIRPALKILRARSRHAAQNNDYAKQFLRLIRNNVPGPSGFGLQMRVTNPDGTQDVRANATIEESFAKWSRRGVCTVDGQLSRADLERLFARTLAVDGEVLLRHVRGWRGNAWRYAVQVLTVDLLDENLNVPVGGSISNGDYRLPKGNEIRMGVERDGWGRPVAYHLLTRHPHDDFVSMFGRRYERVAASEIMHAFVAEEIGAARGVPWMHAGMRRLAMLGGYEEAELVAARTAASKMGFFTSENGETEELTGDAPAGDGDLISEAEPGTFEKLPPGVDFKSWSPEHPTQAFPAFLKSMLRGFASGVGVNYNALASDLEGVNYSSMRHGALQDRDEWKTLQDFQVAAMGLPIFEAWLDMGLLAGAIGNFPATKFEKFNAPEIVGRGWQWVDPKNDAETAEKQIALGINTRQRLCAERGIDFADTVAQLRIEREMLEAAGLYRPPGTSPAAQAQPDPTAGDAGND